MRTGLIGLLLLSTTVAAQARETVTGTLTEVQEGDYQHCIVKDAAGKTYDLWPSSELKTDCHDLVGKRVRATYRKVRREIPEAGEKVEILSLEALAPEDGAVVSRTQVMDAKEKALLLGTHPLTLQWIGWERPGKATVSEKDGSLFIDGEQRDKKGNFVRVRGKVLEVSKRQFVIDGQIDVQVDYLNGGKNCPHIGRLTFKRTGKRRYWRLQEMQSPCDIHVDYVDVYLRR